MSADDTPLDLYRHLFRTADVGLALCDMDGQLVQINQAYADLLGRSRDETLRLSYWQITPKAFEKEEDEQLKSLMAKGEYGPYLKTYLHKNGSHVAVELKGKVIQWEGREYIWSVVQRSTPSDLIEAGAIPGWDEAEQRISLGPHNELIISPIKPIAETMKKPAGERGELEAGA